MTPGGGPPVVLTIAGSDSGGCAGIQADLAAFASCGVFGTTAVTALTAQSTVGVHGVLGVPAGFVVDQVEAVLADLPVAAVKTGMLGTAEVVGAVADLAAAGRLPNLVVDPVVVATSGDRLAEPAAVAAYRERLLPSAVVVTPNRDEAGSLVGRELHDLHDVCLAAAHLAALGPQVVVVTGGEVLGDGCRHATDIVVAGGVVHELRAPRVATTNDHGSGCSFSALVAAGLAIGLGPLDAVRRAKAQVHAALRRSAGWRLGAGRGPLGHLVVGAAAHPPGVVAS